MEERGKLLLVDGSYFAYRSFYAVREMYGGGDMGKNAVFGFCRDMKRMTERCGAERVGVTWDGGLPEDRLRLLPEYKQQRPSMPDGLKEQLPHIREVCSKMGMTNLRVGGKEADDLIASYTKAGISGGYSVVIATNDKDIFQLVGERVSIYTTTKKHIKDGGTHAFLGSEEVSAIWNVKNPSLIRDVLALTGDSSDNIPGVPGIGPKTAAKLIAAAGDVGELYRETVAYANPRIAKLLHEHRAVVERNLALVGLDSEIPLPVPIEDLGMRTDTPSLCEFLRGFGFEGLARDWERSAARGGGAKDVGTTSSKAREGETQGSLFSFRAPSQAGAPCPSISWDGNSLG